MLSSPRMTRSLALRLAPVVAALGLTLSACAADEPEDGEAATDQAAVTSGCSSSFDACVDGRGGRSCADRCISTCRAAVASCLSGGGGKTCKSRCAAPACSEQEEWTTIPSRRCAFIIPAPSRNPGPTGSFTTFPGKARATCTYSLCTGAPRRLLRCTEWNDSRGRAQCTEGVQVDDAGNPYGF